MKKWITDNKVLFGVLIGLLVILGISTNAFLFTKDDGGITGIEAIRQSGSRFWFWLVFASAVSGIGTYFLVKNLKKSGGVGVGYGSLVAILLPLLIVFGKACENKTDRGVTSPKGSPTQVEKDTTRVAAEDLLQKK